MSNIQIWYWPFGGRTAVARLALAHAGIPCEFNGINSFEQWEEAKKNADLFPTEDIPVMRVDGRLITESAAITQFAGVAANLMPEGPVGYAVVAELLALSEEVLSGFWGTCYYKTSDMMNPGKSEEELKALRDGPYKETLCFYATRVNAIVELNREKSEKHVYGDKLTMADLVVWNFSKMVNEEDCYAERVGAIKRVADMVNSISPNEEFVKLRDQFNS